MRFLSKKIAVLRIKMFKIGDKTWNFREITHFEHQKTISEHLFHFLEVSLHQKKILMVKVYG